MTQKDIINEIREEQKRMAKEQLQLASNLSIFMNKQDNFNQKITNLLESDVKTKRKGFIEKVEVNDSRITDLEIKNKITAGKIVTATVILSSIFSIIGTVVWKLIDFLDK